MFFFSSVPVLNGYIHIFGVKVVCRSFIYLTVRLEFAENDTLNFIAALCEICVTVSIFGRT